jgi:hypothetical protein
VVALTGVAIAAGSLVALFISETGRLFGFSEDGYGTPIIIAIASEIAALVFLIPVVAHRLRQAAVARPVQRRPGEVWPHRA